MNKIIAGVIELVDENARLKMENAELSKQLSDAAADVRLALLNFATDKVVESLEYNLPSCLQKVDDHEEIVEVETWLARVEERLTNGTYSSRVAELQKYCLNKGIKIDDVMKFLRGALVRWYADKTNAWLDQEKAEDGTESK